MQGRKPKFDESGNEIKCPISVFDYKKYREGSIFRTNKGELLTIIKYNRTDNVVVKFLDNFGYETTTTMQNIKNGEVHNPYYINQYGGYLGVGLYKADSKIYAIWKSLLKRANAHLDRESYNNTTVASEWLNYQNFAYWYDTYIKLLNPAFYDQYQIDKDLKQWNQLYKIYSPSTCCIIPAQLNLLFAGFNAARKDSINKDLPHGVRYSNKNPNGRLIAEIRDFNPNGTSRKRHIGTYDTVEEAYAAYAEEKKKAILDMTNFYYSQNAILFEVYEIIMNIKILSYPLKEYTNIN